MSQSRSRTGRGPQGPIAQLDFHASAGRVSCMAVRAEEPTAAYWSEKWLCRRRRRQGRLRFDLTLERPLPAGLVKPGHVDERAVLDR